MTTGRPTKYSPDLAREFCRRVAEGRTNEEICADADMPHVRSVYRWLDEYPDFCHLYLTAKGKGMLVLVCEPRRDDERR